MENLTIIAVINTKDLTKECKDTSNEQFLKEAKLCGKIYSLIEFENACNKDEIVIKSVFIRVLEVTKSNFRLV